MQGKGWECPKCGNVYAPWVPQCAKCNTPGTLTPLPSPFRFDHNFFPDKPNGEVQ